MGGPRDFKKVGEGGGLYVGYHGWPAKKTFRFQMV